MHNCLSLVRLLGPDAGGWASHSIGEFLGKAADWGRVRYDRPAGARALANPWQRAAQILHAGKYEER